MTRSSCGPVLGARFAVTCWLVHAWLGESDTAASAPGLAAGRVGQADDGEGGQAVAGVDLDGGGVALGAEQRTEGMVARARAVLPVGDGPCAGHSSAGVSLPAVNETPGSGRMRCGRGVGGPAQGRRLTEQAVLARPEEPGDSEARVAMATVSVEGADEVDGRADHGDAVHVRVRPTRAEGDAPVVGDDDDDHHGQQAAGQGDGDHPGRPGLAGAPGQRKWPPTTLNT